MNVDGTVKPDIYFENKKTVLTIGRLWGLLSWLVIDEQLL